MKTIAFIVQRYGSDINGGAELHCRQVAEKLTAFYKVEVLTTCAFDTSWADHYPAGLSETNKVIIRRFKVVKPRNRAEMKRLRFKINIYKRLSSYRMIKKKVLANDCYDWVLAQGPTTPQLVDFLKKNEKRYDCLIFYTYLYYPTVFGIETNPRKTIFIPTAHDEWAIRLPIYQEMFHIPACIIYNTAAEKRLVNRIFHNNHVFSEIAGVGIDVPQNISNEDPRERMNIHSDYILYIGRINPGKISDEDFKWFLNYRRETGKNIKLVLIGRADMKIPSSSYILHFGYVDEPTKFNLLKNCLFLFQPSRYESLSIVVLEAFMMGKPVVVREECEVMKDHVDHSNGGYYYNDYESFETAFDHLLDDKSLNIKKGKAGKLYAEKNYNWETILEKFRNIIENIDRL